MGTDGHCGVAGADGFVTVIIDLTPMHDDSGPACLRDPAGRAATALASWLAVHPAGLDEIAPLGRTLWRRRDDILAFFDHHVS